MKKKLIIIFLSLFVTILIALGFGVNYLFNYAIVSGKKDFIKAENPEKLKKQWDFSDGYSEDVFITSNDGLKLKGRYIKNKKKTNKVAIVAHGYMSEGLAMGNYAKMFNELGYDVLVQDNRGHGDSEGKYVGFGWLDRLDYVKWIDEVLKLKGKSTEIGLFGVSMGASTIMMTSGENLPPQVKWLIADCGFDSVANELTYQLKNMFQLPAFPLIPLTSTYTKVKAGYSFYEANAVNQLRKNKLPLLLIHGDNDDFVPLESVYPLYEATKGPKELEIFEGAKHATSYNSDSKKYKEIVKKFLFAHEKEN